jgi:hypothetical protein
MLEEILHFMELFRLMILKTTFVFEGRKPYSLLDSLTVYPLWDTRAQLFFHVVSLAFESGKRHAIPFVLKAWAGLRFVVFSLRNWAHTMATEISTWNGQALIHFFGRSMIMQLVNWYLRAAKLLLTRIVGRAVNYDLITLLFTYMALVLLRNMSIILLAYACKW